MSCHNLGFSGHRSTSFIFKWQALLFCVKIILWHSHWCSKFLWCVFQFLHVTGKRSSPPHFLPTNSSKRRPPTSFDSSQVGSRDWERFSAQARCEFRCSSFFEWHLVLYLNLFLFVSEGTCRMFGWRRLGTHGQESWLMLSVWSKLRFVPWLAQSATLPLPPSPPAHFPIALLWSCCT